MSVSCGTNAAQTAPPAEMNTSHEVPPQCEMAEPATVHPHAKQFSRAQHADSQPAGPVQVVPGSEFRGTVAGQGWVGGEKK